LRIISIYLLKKFVKYFIIILISLEAFFIAIDLFHSFKWLPESANLQFLYMAYYSFFILTITFPLSLVFAWIATITEFVKHSELVAFFSLGYSYRDILTPILTLSTMLILILLSLQATPLAYAESQKARILDNEYFTSFKEQLLLKYDNYFVYFEKLQPVLKKAENIKVFKIEDDNVVETIEAKNAIYQNDRWYIVDAKVLTKPKDINWDSTKITVKREKFLYILEGFKPKILDNVYESKSQYSISDAIEAFILLREQGLSTDKIRSSLYQQIVGSFFVIPTLVLIFIFTSINKRVFNIAKFSTVSIFLTLIVWGSLFLLYKLSIGGVLIPEFAILLPLGILLFLTRYFYIKRIKRI
jgi:lipopolysaccharide export system permease protein